MNKSVLKNVLMCLGLLASLFLCIDIYAATSGAGGVASQVTGNLKNIALLITAASYVAGMGFAVGAVVKFKAHKDNPTQIPIGMPVALLFVAAALLFIPSVFSSSGATLFTSGVQGGISGVTSF